MHKTASIRFANTLKQLMGARGISVKTLSKKSGVSARMIYMILKGERKPTIEVIERLANALGLSAWELLLPIDDIDAEMLTHLESLLLSYATASEEGRELIWKVAEREAKYGTTN